MAQDAERLALGDFETDILERPQIGVASGIGPDEALLERGAPLVEEPEALRDVLDVDGDGHCV